jgi:hypothetical protein
MPHARRWILAALTLLFLFVCTAAGASSFSFRSGITWDTTPAQMLAAEGLQEGDENFNQHEDYGFTFFFLKEAAVYYVFRGEQLVMAYSLPSRDAFSAELEQMTALYGSPADIAADTVATLLNLVIPDSAGSGDIAGLSAWRLSDGTLAAMFAIGDFNFQIYFHEQRILGFE